MDWAKRPLAFALDVRHSTRPSTGLSSMGHPSMKNLILAAFAALALAAPSASAQGITQPGFELTGTSANPSPFSAYVSLGDGTRVHYDGIAVTHLNVDGAFIQTLHVFPSFLFAGAIAADPAGDSVLVGESTNGGIYRVEMDGSGATLLATLPFNFSAAYESPGVAYVSAAVCGWSCGNDIFKIDTALATATPVAHVTGPSGPVAFSSSGDLYYGTSTDTFPAPTGAGALWKFSAASLATGSLLGDADAEVLCDGIDLVSSIAVDHVMGDVVIATNLFDGSFNVIADDILLLRPDGTIKDVVSTSAGAYRSHVELQPERGLGHFRAYQPRGVRLTWLESDQIHSIQPSRPEAAVMHNGGGSYSFVVSGAEPGGAMLITFGDSGFHQGNESSYQLSFDFLFHTGLPINKIRRVGQFLMPCDASGTATFPFWDGGNLTGTIVFQGIITDEHGAFTGSSEAAFH